jgi:hypothetical protein
MDAHVPVAVSGALRFAERVDKRRAFKVLPRPATCGENFEGKRNGGESD